MTLRKNAEYWYGDDHSDLRLEIERYSKANGYVAEHFADPKCACGSDTFALYYDEEAGVAVRVCSACESGHYIADSKDYIDDADLGSAYCVCDVETFQISVGLALYSGSDDVRWLYVGCRCSSCGLVGVYADWKNEYSNFRALLAMA